MSLIQDFYKEVVSTAWAAGTGKRYVSAKPTPSIGILVLSPSSPTLREIIRYTSTGTDGGGDYLMVSERGVGGTTDQAHEAQEPIRMNVTGEHLDDIYAAIAAVVAGGAQDASTVIKGIGTVSVAPASPTAPIFVGDNDPRVPTEAEKTRIPSVDEDAALAGSLGLPSATNLYLTQENEFSANVDQSQTTRDSGTVFGEANATTRRNKIAQSFIAGRVKTRGVELYKDADTGTFTGTVTVSLQADTAGSPSGVTLASVTITNAAWLALAVGAFQVIFSSEYSMTKGATYWIVPSTSTSDNSNHPNLGINTAGGYGNGSVKYNNTTDGWVAVSTVDLYFKTLNGINGQVISNDDRTALLNITNRLLLLDITAGTLVSGTSEVTSYTANIDSTLLAIPGRGFRARSTFNLAAPSTVTSPDKAMTLKVKLGGVTLFSVVYTFADSISFSGPLRLDLMVFTTAAGVQSYMYYISGSSTTTIGAGVAVGARRGSGTITSPAAPAASTALAVTFQSTDTDGNFNAQTLDMVVEAL